MSSAALALAGCPGDPTEANPTTSVSGSGESSLSAEGPTTLDDDSVSVTITDTSDSSDPTTDTDPTAPPAECGNRIVEDGEACDLGPDNTMGATCTSECQTNVCGDSYVGYGESCDPPGEDCTGECILESCGNGQLDRGEECDPSIDKDCLPTCLLPEPCGDGVIDTSIGEQCEPLDLGGQTCASIGMGFTAGDLQCDTECHFLTGSCTTCGNGTAESPVEACDGGDLLGATCIALGYDGGSLGCSGSCTYDENPCFDCGDGVREGPEQCDGADLGGSSCASLGFAPGAGLACTGLCALDTSGCSLCGNGMINGGEECDQNDIPEPVCADLPSEDWDSGMVTCDPDCHTNESACCYSNVGHNCETDGQCCGALECDNQDDRCCQPAGGSCTENDNNACCSGNCNFGSDTCVGNDAA